MDGWIDASFDKKKWVIWFACPTKMNKDWDRSLLNGNETDVTDVTDATIKWRFPEMGVPPNHLF